MNKVTSKMTSMRVDCSEAEPTEREQWARRRLIMEEANLNYTPLGIKSRRNIPIFERSLKCFQVLLKLTGLYGSGNRNAHNIRLRKIELAFTNLPDAFDGYSIMQLSDMHIDCSPGLEQAILDVVKGTEPDICVMTGDFREANDGSFEQLLDPMRKVINGIRAKGGVFAVLGNHDDHRMGLAFEEHLGVRLLVNERAEIWKDGSNIVLTGTDDPHRFFTEEVKTTLTKPLDTFGIALVHSPEMAHEAERGGHSLYLCGHTHGGQVALPGGKLIITRLHRNQNLAVGLWKVGNMVGYTNSGAGVSGPVVRYNTQGEVALITLKKG